MATPAQPNLLFIAPFTADEAFVYSAILGVFPAFNCDLVHVSG